MASASITFRDPAGNVRVGSSTAYVGDSWLVSITAPGGAIISETETVNGFGNAKPWDLFPIQPGYNGRQWGGLNYKYTENDIGPHVQTYYADGVALPAISFTVLPACSAGLSLINGVCSPVCASGYVLDPSANKCVVIPAASPYVPSAGAAPSAAATVAAPPASAAGLSSTVMGIPVWALGLAGVAALYFAGKK